jgi:hypothetical protein
VKDTLKLVYLEWVDSSGSTDGWYHLKDFEPNLVWCKSVGWVVYETDEYITVLPHMGDESQGRGELTIPVCAIKKRKVIRL